MTGLLNLPDELVHQVLSDLLQPNPGQFRFLRNVEQESFDSKSQRQGLSTLAALCRTCSTLRRLSEPVLYHFVFIPKANLASLMSLLRCWDSRPHCTEYTRRLTVEADGQGGNPSENISNEDAALASKMAKRLGISLREGWFENSWNTDVLIELVMLQAVRLQSAEVKFTELRGVNRPVFECLLPEHGVSPDVRFDNLKYLFFAQAHCQKDELDHIFDRAPSLKELRLYLCDFNLPGRPFPASLTDLCMSDCPLSPRKLESAILNAENLVRLEVIIMQTNARDVARFIWTLAEKHAETLKSLAIRIRRHSGARVVKVKLPLDMLTSLESLTTDVSSFGVGPIGLVKCLPPSLRTLRLVRLGQTNPRELLEFAVELKEAKQCGLEHLTVLSAASRDWETVGDDADTELDYEGIIRRDGRLDS